MRVSRVIIPVLAFSAIAVVGTPAQSRPPSTSKARKMVQAYFDAGAEEQAQIEAQIDLLRPLRKSELKRWKSDLLKYYGKSGRRVVSRGEAFWYDEEARRGRYFVHGKGRDGLLIGLHGGGVDSADAASALGTFKSAVDELNWTGIFPEVLEKTELGWTDSGTEEFVLELIDAALRTFDIDPDRVYLAGHSMGGYGTWVIGGHHPDRFAGLAAFAGGPSPIYNQAGMIVRTPKGVLPNLRNVPFLIYQSLDDPQVSPDANQFAVKALGKLKEKYGGFPFVYDEVDGRGHGAPEGGHLPNVRWAGEHGRDLAQKKLLWEPSLDWKHRFYWLRWDRPVAEERVRAEINGNVIDVETRKPRLGFTVFLTADMIDLERDVVVRYRGEERFRGSLEPRVGSMLRSLKDRYDPAALAEYEIRIEAGQ
jgi:pimeloyl-ACP methyl ester carboxylesterase